jgi:hypothetical protein
MYIDHVTYQISRHELHRPEIDQFFADIGFQEVQPDPVIEKGWDVRWFEPEFGPDWYEAIIHLVGAQESSHIGLGHFCVRVGEQRYGELRNSQWCERDSGSGRIWLAGPAGLRVEVRP